ncbi:hypothetical protein MKW92_034094 [Papaver armeniacum]|nr:hypothetical protein MKW92_034094 [Papaver armeniacum]
MKRRRSLKDVVSVGQQGMHQLFDHMTMKPVQVSYPVEALELSCNKESFN